MRRFRWFVCLFIPALLIAGCQKVGRYKLDAKIKAAPLVPIGPPKTTPGKTDPKAAKTDPKTPDTSDYAWAHPARGQMDLEVPLVFVHQGTSPKEWDKLDQFMTHVPPMPNPTQVSPLVAVAPVIAAGISVSSAANRVVKVKVPLGLDDPTPLIPSSNSPTYGKWLLGKRLFFDDDQFLIAKGKVKLGCVSCHDPAKGFSQPGTNDGYNPPTIMNTVYNAHQFWDGRAQSLEDAVQRSIQEEKLPEGQGVARHAWYGVIGRLRENKDYAQRFAQVFGTPPTQETVSKALATYMRTVLSGGSIQDKAEQAWKAGGGKIMTAKNYVKALDKTALKSLQDGPKERPAEEVAQELFKGFQLFHDEKVGCAKCHKGNNYTDDSRDPKSPLTAEDAGFHNLGIGNSMNMGFKITFEPGMETGRFAVVPPYLKNFRMIGAYKTPTLRALPRTPNYFHDASRQDLTEVVRWHVQSAPAIQTPYLDPDIKKVDLKEEEIKALVLFLKALEGEPTPADVGGTSPAAPAVSPEPAKTAPPATKPPPVPLPKTPKK